MTSHVLNNYIADLKANLRIDGESENEVLDELKCHLEDEFDDMVQTGIPEEEAARTAVRLLGSAKLIAKKIYEAHSQGSWKHALLASVPHMLFAALFALNWWKGIGLVVIVLSSVLGIALVGWLHNKPMWLFPWLGYCMAPVLAAGLLLLYLPRVWSWISILIYIPLALWFIYSVTIRTIRKDWLYGALMLLPAPIAVGWYIALGHDGNSLQLDTDYIQGFAPLIAMSFLALAGVAATFVRMRKRWLRTTLLATSQFVILILVTFYTRGRLALWSSALLALATVGMLIGLSYIDRRMRRRSIFSR